MDDDKYLENFNSKWNQQAWGRNIWSEMTNNSILHGVDNYIWKIIYSIKQFCLQILDVFFAGESYVS